MEISVQQFIAQLTQTGVMTSDQVSTFMERTDSPPASAEVLSAAMIAAEILTPFQSQHVRQANAEQLIVGEYLLLDVVGTGGMGQVYRARHRQTGEFVALKIMPSKTLGSPTALKRFEREMQIACELRHPHVAQVLEGDASGPRPWFAMELVPGTDLQQYVDEQGPLDLETAIGYIEQAAQGLESLHERGIIHRDIKPSNLILTPEGAIKLVDFGLARQDTEAAKSPDQQFTMLTESWAAMGTVDYMAPEQAHDARSVDQRADLYSLGCTLYFLVHGRPPFRGETDVETLLAHSEGKIPRLTTDRSRHGQALNQRFRRLLAKQPEQRFQSVSELSAAFEEALSVRSSPLPKLALVGIPAAFLLVGWMVYVLTGESTVQKETADLPAAFSEDLSHFELLFSFDDEIMIFDLATAELHPVIEGGLKGTQPEWSHDGSLILFRDGQTPPEICMINDDGSNLRQLTNNRSWEHTPKWSPDGTQIAFAGKSNLITPAVAGDGQQMEIWIMNSDGSNLHKLTNNQHDDWHATWKPDGEWIAVPDRGLGDLQLFRPDGSEGQYLRLSRYPYLMSWNPKQDDLLAVQADATDGSQQLFLMTISNASERQITSEGDLNGYPCWSPDGRYLAYFHVPTATVWHKGGPGDVRIYDRESGQHTVVMQGEYEAANSKISWRVKP